jgi:protein TonB
VRYFQYPRLARRKGWEGKVHLQFTVQPDGKLTGIKILNGSPFGALNQSAVDTMKRINHLNQVNEGMLGGPLQMEIPIIYQLK